MTYSPEERMAAQELLEAARRLPSHRDMARTKLAAEATALAILMGRPLERVRELDRAFLASFS